MLIEPPLAFQAFVHQVITVQWVKETQHQSHIYVQLRPIALQIQEHQRSVLMELIKIKLDNRLAKPVRQASIVIQMSQLLIFVNLAIFVHLGLQLLQK